MRSRTVLAPLPRLITLSITLHVTALVSFAACAPEPLDKGTRAEDPVEATLDDEAAHGEAVLDELGRDEIFDEIFDEAFDDAVLADAVLADAVLEDAVLADAVLADAVLEDASLEDARVELLDLVDDSPDLDEPDELDESSEEPDVDSESESGVIYALANAGQYRNPLGPNCADPGIVKIPGDDGPTFWAACTGKNFPLFKSRDLVHWTAAGKIFTNATAPAWAGGNNWAPEVHRIGNKLVAYFTALSPSRGRMCIGAARANQMEGPWEDIGHPLVCDSHVSLIDATVHTDPESGHRFLYYKTDGNGLHPQEKTIIYGHRLKANGIGFIGKRHALLRNTLAWEGDVVEAPWVIHRGEYYYMFYSGFRYCNETYGVGVARSKSPLGPFTKKGAPILHSNGTWGGPGHNSFVRAAGKPYLVYHAWEAPHSCGDSGTRKLMLDRVTWSGGWPVINNGTPSVGQKQAPFAP